MGVPPHETMPYEENLRVAERIVRRFREAGIQCELSWFDGYTMVPSRRKGCGDWWMDKFIAAQNIKHFRDRLRSEPDQVTRATLQKLLVQEEDKLAADLALLEDLDKEIAKCDAVIERQKALVVTLESKGSDGGTARALLDGLIQTKFLHFKYRNSVLGRMQRSSNAAC
jgi:hypothetical protein